MKWFLAKLVFRIFCGDGNHTPQFEEQLRLIRAEDELHAFYKARLLGEGDHAQAEASIDAVVKWKFMDVTEIHPVTDFTDGAEVHSLVREENNADMYIRATNRTAKQLLQQSLHHFTHVNGICIGA